MIREDDEMDFTGSALLLGLIVHGYLERHRFGEGFNADLFDNIWEKSLAENYRMNYCSVDELKALRQKARDQLNRTINDERLIGLLKGARDYAEAPFLINVSPGVDFRGVIDRVFLNKTVRSWSIIDWKSNELKGRSPSGIAEEKNYNLQLSCYKYAVEQITKEKVEGLYIYFTDAGHLLEGKPEPDGGEFIIEVSKKITASSKAGLPPMEPGCADKTMPRCRLCGYLGSFCGQSPISG